MNRDSAHYPQPVRGLVDSLKATGKAVRDEEARKKADRPDVLRGAHAILEAAGIPLEDFVSYAEENGHKAPEFPNQETNISWSSRRRARAPAAKT